MAKRRTLFTLRGPVLAATLLISALAGEGCQGDRTPVPSSPTEDLAAPKTVTVLKPPGYDHRILLPPTNWPAMHLLYQPLFAVNQQGEIEGRLVRSWEHSDGGHVWTYHLRSDITWHDGTPVTAEDYRFTVELQRAQFKELPGSRSVDVVDDSTIRVTFGDNSQNPLDDYAVLLPAHLLADLDGELWDWDYWENPVGNGPYQWVRRTANLMVELEAYPEYFMGKPAIERVVVRLAVNPLVELQAGNVDIAGGYPSIPVSQLPALRDDPEIGVYWTPTQGISCLFLNHEHPALSDPDLRRALTLAIDRAAFQRIREIPDEMPFWDVPVSPRHVRRGEFPEPLPYDPERAARLLSEAGWEDSDGDGIRDKDGSPLSIDVLALNWNESSRLLQFVQSELRKVGIDLEIEPTQRHVASQRFQAGDYGAFGLTDAGGPRFWDGLLGPDLERDSPTGYWNPRLAELIKELQQTLVPEEQDLIYRQMWPIFEEDVPVLFLGPGVWFAAANRRIRGLESPLTAWPTTLMGQLWLEEDR